MQVGFIGIGNVGITIARDLATSDHDLSVFDVNEHVLAEFRERGAFVCQSPGEVASRADVIGICVSTDKQVLEVLRGKDGIYSVARPGTVIAIHSTIHLPTLSEIAEEAATYGVRVVDAPVSRGPRSPQTKATVFMLGGEEEDVEIVAAYAQPAALAIVRAGGPGSALVLKICNNAMTYLNLMIQRDVFRILESYGVGLEKLGEVVTGNGAGSENLLFAIEQRTSATARSHHVIGSAQASADLAEKDLSAAVDAAREVNLDVPAIAFGQEGIRKTMLGQ